MAKYFGTDGVRGEVGKYPITPDFALRLGYAAGKVLGRFSPRNGVIIGKDTRLSGYLFESGLEAGFCYAGIDVYMAGPIPTPAVAYLTTALHLSCGVVISASHNPYTDNGIKFFSHEGTKLSDEIEAEIEAELDKSMIMAKKLGRVFRLEDGKGRYIEFCKGTFPKHLTLNGLKIVLDCANGATYQVAPSVFRELGAEVVKIACDPDGLNINNNCGSTNPDNLIAAVKQYDADLGIAFDGDGDRVLFVDSDGNAYNGDKLVYVILQSYLAQGKTLNGVVGTVMTNLAMESKLNISGFELVRSRVGDRYVLEELNKRGWIIGGEASGHILCLDKHSTGDGIISALQVLSAVKQLQQPLAKLIDWQDYPQVMINVNFSQEDVDWQNRVNLLLKQATLDLGSRGRIIIRPSGTEPVIRIMVESTDANLAEMWAKKLADAVQNTVQNYEDKIGLRFLG